MVSTLVQGNILFTFYLFKTHIFILYIIDPNGKWAGKPVTNHNTTQYAKLEKSHC